MSTWIPISERMPTREDANDAGEVLAVDARGQQWLWGFRACPADMFGRPPVAWLPLPRYTPPELMPTNGECDQLAQDIWASRWSAARDTGIPVIRAWFADVTARIERERGQ